MDEWKDYWESVTNCWFSDEDYYQPVKLMTKVPKDQIQDIAADINEKTIGDYTFVAKYGEDYEHEMTIHNKINKEIDDEGKEIYKEHIRTIGDLYRVENRTDYIHVEGEYPSEKHPNACITIDCIREGDARLGDYTLFNSDLLADQYAEIYNNIANYNIEVEEEGNVIQKQEISIVQDYQCDDKHLDYDGNYEPIIAGYRWQNHIEEVEYDDKGQKISDKITTEKAICGKTSELIDEFDKNSDFRDSVGPFVTDGEKVPSSAKMVETHTIENTYKNGEIEKSEVTIRKDDSIFVTRCEENRTEISLKQLGEKENELNIVIEKSENGEISISSTFADKTNGYQFKSEDLVANRNLETGELQINKVNLEKHNQYMMMAKSNLDLPMEFNKTIQELDLSKEVRNIGNIGNVRELEEKYPSLEVGRFGEREEHNIYRDERDKEDDDRYNDCEERDEYDYNDYDIDDRDDEFDISI